MKSKTTDAEILSYLPLLEEGEKKSLLGIIETFLKLKQPGRDERISIEQYNAELDAALARIKAGNYHTQEEAEAQINEW
ncbi:hypothetical protein GCM10010967_08690 [Dyadobacter beijingensis]|uniref:Addiction module component n=1 Tax=Dyadobacter beijingensis TaxID=365489 RepID=A0ABQ2HHG5_9BACT|nr:hypothetical protein [Dyadobacter beijingensis]GGM79232.1 hypothetical protein GCM10010967_08690 [Dyadobacter beijingensis]